MYQYLCWLLHSLENEKVPNISIHRKLRKPLQLMISFQLSPVILSVIRILSKKQCCGFRLAILYPNLSYKFHKGLFVCDSDIFNSYIWGNTSCLRLKFSFMYFNKQKTNHMIQNQCCFLWYGLVENKTDGKILTQFLFGTDVTWWNDKHRCGAYWFFMCLFWVLVTLWMVVTCVFHCFCCRIWLKPQEREDWKMWW